MIGLVESPKYPSKRWKSCFRRPNFLKSPGEHALGPLYKGDNSPNPPCLILDPPPRLIVWFNCPDESSGQLIIQCSRTRFVERLIYK